MGAAASVKNEGEIRQMDAEQLAKYAEDSKMNKFVSETIRKKDLDGELVYQLDDGDLLELADNKNIEKIYVYDSKAKTVHGFDTSSFFTVKKPQKKK